MNGRAIVLDATPLIRAVVDRVRKLIFEAVPG